MSTAPVEPSKPDRGKRIALWSVALTLVAAAGLAAWAWWERQQADQASAEQQQRLDALLQRGVALRKELDGIKPPEAPACPPGHSLKVSAPGAVRPGTAASAVPAGLTQPAMAGESVAVLSEQALAQLMENTTALVLVPGDKSLGSGTGFFVGPDLVVTNRHVVESQTGTILLTSKSLGKVRRATLLKLSDGTAFGTPDFALLRMEDGTAPAFLKMAPDIGKLAPIVAAGYPGVVIRSDPNFQRLVQGDASAAPDLNLTQGAVQSKMAGSAGTPLVVHTAFIAKGNSGGPLVDACGRVVAVNTFMSYDQSQAAKVNYAILSEGLNSFMASAGASMGVDARACAARR